MNCKICPRECQADRENGKTGYCKETASLRVARASLHMWEEPCISGTNGSGAVFFSGCPLRCVFCQNSAITGAGEHAGRQISVERLSELFLKLQAEHAHNINLVTPTHFAPQIADALRRARSQGLSIPVVYNTGGYEKTETLRMLKGLVDIYLPDLKYHSAALGERYSHAPDYFDIAAAAIDEMFRQTGRPVLDASGLMQSGVIVRHLMLPGHLSDSKKILRYLYETYRDDIYVSIMNQYTPVKFFPDMPKLNRRISHKEYNALVDYCISLGYENAFIQEGETALQSFIPSFDGEGV